MKRLLILLAGLVLVGPIYGQIDGDISLISYPHQKEYVEWGITQYPESHVALAVSNNGAWGSGYGGSIASAKKWAIKACKKHSRSWPCLVADIDFKNISPQLFKKYVGLKSNKPSAAVEKDCYEKFHEQDGRKWRADVVGGDTDQDFDVTKCFPFVSKDLLTWLGSDSPASSSSTTASSSKYVWCATKHSFWKVNRPSACGSGKVFASKYQAQAEHQRLKTQATASTSGSNSVWCATKIEFLECK